MNYIEDWKLYLWKKLLLKSDYFSQQNLNLFQAIRNFVFGQDWGGTVGNDLIAQALIEMSNFQPPAVEITNVRMLKDYRDYHYKRLSEEEAKKALAAATSSSYTNPNSKTVHVVLQPNHGLPKEVDQKLEKLEKDKNLADLDLADLKTMAYNAKLPQYLWNYVSFDAKFHKEPLEKKLNDYIDSFIQGDLVAPRGFRLYGPRQQMERMWQTIQVLATGQGSKNLKVTLRDIVPPGRSPVNEHNLYKFYEMILALERSGDITVTDIVGSEAVISIAPRHLKNLDPDLRIPPAFAKFEGKFVEHELHWYCPICGNKIKVFEDKDTLAETLTIRTKRCKNGHENKIMIIDDKLYLENTPIAVSEAMAHFKRRNKVQKPDGV